MRCREKEDMSNPLSWSWAEQRMWCQTVRWTARWGGGGREIVPSPTPPVTLLPTDRQRWKEGAFTWEWETVFSKLHRRILNVGIFLKLLFVYLLVRCSKIPCSAHLNVRKSIYSVIFETSLCDIFVSSVQFSQLYRHCLPDLRSRLAHDLDE